MKILLFFIFLYTSVFSKSLGELISLALDNSPSLEVINKKISFIQTKKEVVDNFKNPKLSFNTNTLPSDQAMSQTVIGISQNIPFYGKRDANKDIYEAKEEETKAKLKDAKAKLVYLVKMEAYRYWEYMELLDVINEYLHITKQAIDLYESYTSIDEANHMGIMKAELSYSELKITKRDLLAKIYKTLYNLSYLTNTDVQDVNLTLKLSKKPSYKELKEKLKNNTSLYVDTKAIQTAKKEFRYIDLQNYPDINLAVSYAFRKNFDNYFNLGFNLSLPIYGTEDKLSEAAKVAVLEKEAKKTDTQIKIENELKAYYEDLNAYYDIYNIIEKEALPQVKHMFELSSSVIATGGDLFKYIDVLFQRLDLKKKSIKAVASYYKTKAKISLLVGELK